jgi:hypothetical protein
MSWRKKPRTRIDEWDLGAPDGWYAMPLEESPGWHSDLAESLVADPIRRELLAQQLKGMRAEVLEVRALWLGLAAWIPAPDESPVCAGLGAEVVVDSPGEVVDRDRLRKDLEEYPLRGMIQHQRTLVDVDLPAGPALLQHDVVSDERTGEIEERIIYHVFPPGADEGIRLTFVTPNLHLGERLAEEADRIAESLVVKLG